MRTALLLLALTATAVPALHAECVASSPTQRLHLVELYTAEGCSSCPPAEQWMSKLRDSDSIIGLEFHVDYWDDLGWRDPFADARYTARQREMAKRETRDNVYTPQIAVDGRVWKNWPKAKPPEPDPADAPVLKMSVVRGDVIQVKVDGSSATKIPDTYRVYVALSENGLSTAVKAGENRGKQLDHDQVVRAFAGPLELPLAEASLKPPAGVDLGKSSVVAFVQDRKSGAVVQAMRLPLAQCAP